MMAAKEKLTFSDYSVLYNLSIEDEQTLLNSNKTASLVAYEIDDERGIRFYDPCGRLKSLHHMYKSFSGWTNWSNE